ncbi:uncharacterized protein BP01DRAFT_72580 [Aspergillus saccharolyticus JOP 1030-1]|uniref:Uncharacterized protein n=1 Tax=Aspergillus saccharolyticus JOP 1030-1 TaxID=1450539 RepID=A0A318ZNH5_9EURO|nr:hypothetical protein BP01DRAFT_72580 [Aspergillus saccharolyticus JOP 1030-1]PYH49171.1 hypothetical protein BP01DRAFT_72580 [Aspergillus saccharolyticus JOP 1030-1]
MERPSLMLISFKGDNDKYPPIGRTTARSVASISLSLEAEVRSKRRRSQLKARRQEVHSINPNHQKTKILRQISLDNPLVRGTISSPPLDCTCICLHEPFSCEGVVMMVVVVVGRKTVRNERPFVEGPPCCGSWIQSLAWLWLCSRRSTPPRTVSRRLKPPKSQSLE